MTDVATKNWYIVHTYSGFEKKVAESLAERKTAYGLADEIGEILIPTEDVVEMRGGRKVVSSKRFFPGYILVEMNMTDNAWHVVKNTPKVTGFSAAVLTCSRICSTSSLLSGVGLAPAPTKPVTFGVFLTTCHALSVMFISTRM